jgi:anti-sigma factor RsiW
VTSRFDVAETFAYVDNCLTSAQRSDFEARLREEAELRREVALWETQNAAIRAAFGAPVSARAAIDLGRNSNENQAVRLAVSEVDWRTATSLRTAEPKVWPAPPRAKTPTTAQKPPATVAKPAENPARQTRTERKSLRRVLVAVLAMAAALFFVATNNPSWPSDKLTAAGIAAYRAFAAPAAPTPLEFRTSNPAALTRWLAPQFARGVVAPELRSSALRLIGGRIAPGTAAGAAFLVYEDAHGNRLGLLIEPLDAPLPSRPEIRKREGLTVAAWTDAGHGFVAIGTDRDAVVELTGLVAAPGSTRP